MESDGSKSGECSFVKAHRGVGTNSGSQQTRDAGKFGVYRMAGSCTGNTITNVEIGDTFPYSNDSSSAAVTEGERLIETATNRGNRREYAIALNFTEDFANQIRAGLRFL